MGIDRYKENKHTLIFKMHSTAESFLRNCLLFTFKDILLFALFSSRNEPTWSRYIWTTDYTNILLIPAIRMCC